MRARLGSLAARVLPSLEDSAFNRQRDRAAPSSVAPRRGHPKKEMAERPFHLVVVPSEGPCFADWGPGNRNFYYEALISAQEIWGDGHASYFAVEPGEDPAQWHARLRNYLHDTGATHFLTHMEHDPGNPDRWSWDVAWSSIAQTWDGAFLGVMFDSAFPIVTMKARRLARISPHYLAVDICTPMAGSLVKRRFEVGPVTMPVSRKSLSMVHERLAGVIPTHDVSFIGALYPYRVELIERLRALGVNVAVNPHRAETTVDLKQSRTNQPGWLDYMAGLAGSTMSINFSRSSAGEFEQLKTRVIEATLAGTFLLTDDKDSTRRFFECDREYGYFDGVDDLPRVVSTWLDKPTVLLEGRLSAQERAQEIALYDFWQGIERGLIIRDLPQLPGFITSVS